jgi:hypothetical protein
MTVRAKVEQAQRFNKATAAAAVTAAAWIVSLFGVEVPAEVQGAFITLAVFIVPNR